MTASYIQLPSDASNTGKKLQTWDNTIGGNDVYSEATTPVNSSGVELATDANPIRIDPVGTTVQPVQIVPITSGGTTTNVQQALTTSANIKSSAGQVYGFDFFNPNTVAVYIFLYNTTTTPGTIGATTNLIFQKGLPAGAGSNVAFPIGIAFSAGIAIAVSTLPSGSSAPSTGLVLTTLFD